MPLVTKVAFGLVATGGLLAIALGDFSPRLWIPSLTCNLVTTGIAIYVINGLIAGRESRLAKSRDAFVLLKSLRRVLDRVGFTRQALAREPVDEASLESAMRRVEVTRRSLVSIVDDVKPALTPDSLIRVTMIAQMLTTIQDLPQWNVLSLLDAIEREVATLWDDVRGDLPPIAKDVRVGKNG